MFYFNEITLKASDFSIDVTVNNFIRLAFVKIVNKIIIKIMFLQGF